MNLRHAIVCLCVFLASCTVLKQYRGLRETAPPEEIIVGTPSITYSNGTVILSTSIQAPYGTVLNVQSTTNLTTSWATIASEIITDQTEFTSCYITNVYDNQRFFRLQLYLPELLETNIYNCTQPRFLWGGNTNLFSVLNHKDAIYVRNTNCWAKGIDLTCVAVWNSYMSNSCMAGTLVTPKHVLTATHFTIPLGSKIRFVTKDNEVIERTITNRVGVPNSQDITIETLDEPISEDKIPFARILPQNFTEYCNYTYKTNGTKYVFVRLPTVNINQFQEALTGDYAYLSAGGACVYYKPLDLNRLQYFKVKISGDSGQPSFLLINSTPILMNLWTSKGVDSAGTGYSEVFFFNQINTTLASMGGGYQLSTIDLSSFRKQKKPPLPLLSAHGRLIPIERNLTQWKEK